MKATGIVRKLDRLGRIVIPMELRTSFDIKKDDPLEIFVDGNSIVIRKYEPGCIFCGSLENVTRFSGKNVCANCAGKIINHSL